MVDLMILNTAFIFLGSRGFFACVAVRMFNGPSKKLHCVQGYWYEIPYRFAWHILDITRVLLLRCRFHASLIVQASSPMPSTPP
jgi:hypothetical protein